MMGDTYRKLPANALITDQSRTVYNDTIDMLRWWKTRYSRTGVGDQKNIVDWDQTLFPVKNSSGADLTASYGILGLDGPLFGPEDNIDEFLNVTALNGVAPTVEDHAGGRWCVVLEPLASDEVSRRACLSGVVPVRVYVGSFDDRFCDVIEAQTIGDETTYLGSGSTGAKILWWEATSSSDDGTIVWAIVQLGVGGSPLTPCELKDDMEPGDTDVDAYPMLANMSDADTSADPIQVNDMPGGSTRALGRDTVGSTAKGARGWYTVGPDGKNYFVPAKRLSNRLKGTLHAVLHTSTTTIQVDSVSACDDGQLPALSSGNLTGVKNDRKCAGASGDVCWVYRDGADWQIEVVVYKSQAAMTAWQYEDTGHTIQDKTRTAVGMFDGDESGWTQIDTTTAACPC